jgi:hypothetical protein
VADVVDAGVERCATLSIEDGMRRFVEWFRSYRRS